MVRTNNCFHLRTYFSNKIENRELYQTLNIPYPEIKLRYIEEGIETDDPVTMEHISIKPKVCYIDKDIEINKYLNNYFRNKYNTITKKLFPNMYIHGLNPPILNTEDGDKSATLYTISNKKNIKENLQKYNVWTTKLIWI